MDDVAAAVVFVHPVGAIAHNEVVAIGSRASVQRVVAQAAGNLILAGKSIDDIISGKPVDGFAVSVSAFDQIVSCHPGQREERVGEFRVGEILAGGGEGHLLDLLCNVIEPALDGDAIQAVNVRQHQADPHPRCLDIRFGDPRSKGQRVDASPIVNQYCPVTQIERVLVCNDRSQSAQLRQGKRAPVTFERDRLQHVGDPGLEPVIHRDTIRTVGMAHHQIAAHAIVGNISACNTCSDDKRVVHQPGFLNQVGAVAECNPVRVRTFASNERVAARAADQRVVAGIPGKPVIACHAVHRIG